MWKVAGELHIRARRAASLRHAASSSGSSDDDLLATDNPRAVYQRAAVADVSRLRRTGWLSRPHTRPHLRDAWRGRRRLVLPYRRRLRGRLPVPRVTLQSRLTPGLSRATRGIAVIPREGSAG